HRPESLGCGVQLAAARGADRGAGPEPGLALRHAHPGQCRHHLQLHARPRFRQPPERRRPLLSGCPDPPAVTRAASIALSLLLLPLVAPAPSLQPRPPAPPPSIPLTPTPTL